MHYALSDIHGDSAAFDAILTMIDLRSEDQLYVIGDVIDRGPDGINLLQRFREMSNAISKKVLLHSKTLSIIHRTAAEKVVVLFYIERKSSIKRMF